ncbi:MAG: beta-hexosaminidase [Bacilli bacterium]|nr:beta-hexosaminidase [Bacilli bacterium]
MGKRTKLIIVVLLFIIVLSIVFLIKNSSNKNESKYLTVMVLTVSDDLVTVRDGNNIIYTFDNINDFTLESGDTVVLEYTGVLNKDISNQSINVINYTTSNEPSKRTINNDIFADFYKMAQTKLDSLSLDEKIGQLLLVRVPDTNKIEDLKKYHFGGYLLFAKDFNSKTKQEVVNMIKGFQEASDIPLLIAVDEEGGSVVRLSSNKNLVSAPFKSSQQLYKDGGFSLIKEDTINKSKILQELGINVNLAPVVDVSTDPNDYMYKRTIGLDTVKTSEYAKTVIEASKNGKVSYTLKHFPGYGNNADTHTGSATDTRSYDDILNNDLPPFTAGINAGAEAVLVSHNIVSSIDPNNPASLSSDIHNLLRNKLNFTGVIITDDLFMKAITDNVSGSATVKAILAGNDLLIVTDYAESVKDIKDAINDGIISEEVLDAAVLKVLAWKYYKGLMIDKIK